MKMIRKCISGFLAVLTVISLLPVQAFAEEAVVMEEEILYASAEEQLTPEEQYEGHAYQAFYGDTISTFGVAAGNRLSGIEKTLYDGVVTVARQIANGQRSSTVIRIGQDVTYQGETYAADVEATFTETTFDLALLHDALLADLPYDLYWYDKTSGVRATRWTRSGEMVQVELYFSVGDNYQGSEEYSTNTTKTGAASRSAANAKSIVAKYAGVTDYNKLLGYKNEIQALVEYDHDAADGGYFDTYIDPWQLISVFDGDSGTNVVCEGYSKAFMYLCDMTSFAGDIVCYTVSGDLNGGAHMWNIVSIEGKNYLVDVTNSDTGTVGQNGGLFLNGVMGDIWNGYTAAGVLFTYDYDMYDLWGEGEDSILHLESMDYDPANAVVGTPVIIGMENTATGIQLTWSAVPGAAKYRLFYKGSNGWQVLTTTAETSVHVIGVVSGASYTFTVRCMNDAEDTYTSAYNATGWTKIYVAQPEITAFENTAQGIKLTWDAVNGAGQYAVFVKTSKGWSKLTTTKDTSYVYTGAKSGYTYTFTVRCVSADGKSYTSSFNTTGWKQTYVAQPAISAFENTAQGIKLTWGAVNGAGQYAVFAKTSKGWQKLTTTTGTSYVYTGAKTGLTYTFTVRCVSADGKSYTSSFNTTGWKQTYVAQPAISAFESAANGIKLTWGAVDGAGQYAVFAKTSKGWQKLTTTTGTSYVYTGAKTGLTYTFTVRCVSADGKSYTSSFNTTGWKYTYSPSPVITRMETNADGIKLTWNAINGAAKYRVFVKTSDGWQKLGDTTATTYTWTGAKTGRVYSFTVRCVSADGKTYTSSFNATGWKQVSAVQPKVTAMQSLDEGIKLTWGAVTGAGQYRVYVKTDSGWVKAGDTTDTSFVYTAAKLGQKYTFTVRCMDAKATTFVSACNTTGWSHTFEPVPEITVLTSTAEGIKLTWGAINGAAKYRVYVKTASGWTKLTDTTGTSYVYEDAVLGQTYSFTVRCLNADGTAFTSAANTTGWSHKYYPAPEVTKITSSSKGVKLTWGAINGAEKYRVFVKTDDGWEEIGDTTGTSLTWKSAKKGTTYVFTVRCINAEETAVTSAFNKTGWTHKHTY